MRASRSGLSGVVTAIVTPMDECGRSVRWDALSELCDFQVRSGVQGLFVCGTVGEGPLLTPEEIKSVLKHVVEVVRGRVKVIAQVGRITSDETGELARYASEVGADACAVLPPYFYSLAPEDIRAHIEAVLAAIPHDFPVYLYNIPSNTKNRLDPGVIEAVAERHPNVVGLKDSSMDFGYFVECVNLFGSKLAIYMGNDAWVLPSLVMGAAGCVSGTATVVPEIAVALYRRFAEGSSQGALEAQTALAQLRVLFRSYSHIGALKAALKLRGLDAGSPRRPLQPVPDEEVTRIQARMEEVLAALGISMRVC